MAGQMETLPLKPFDEMTASDYAAIGFKCGLEVHQQVLTRSKLFCRCPAGHYSPEYDAEILRHMRPTLSEMGEYDGTALMEKKTRKNIHYRIHHATVCTYEFDDTPPFPIDDEAVDIALEISLLLRLNLVDELHIARKQYLDGSIPAGFQRTAIIGIEGWLPFPGDETRRVGVRQLSIEEDSCREVADQGHERTYLTDRLGTPLIEVVTEPDMVTPTEVANVGNLIRKLLRSTQKVRRGCGATRQDVNVSVTGGTRIEIKGVPQIWRIPHLVYNEASRQVALLRLRQDLHDRGVTPDSIDVESDDVSSILAKTSYAPIRSALDAGDCVRAVRLGGFAGLLSRLTQEHTTFAKEFADRIRVIACLTNLPNMVHSDAASDSLWAQDWQKLARRMKSTPEDAIIVVWGSIADTQSAADEIAIRAKEATIGVPSDTRQPLKDGTTGFERVLPGPERMYPDTDLPPIPVAAERSQRIRAHLPEDVWVTEQRFLDAGMVPHDAAWLCISPLAPLVTRAIERRGLAGSRLGVLFAQRQRALSRAGLRPERLADDAFETLFDAHADGRLTWAGIGWLIERLLARDNPRIDGAAVVAMLDAIEMAPAPDDVVQTRIAHAIEASASMVFPTVEKHARHVTGRVMVELIGRIDGGRLRSLVEERCAGSGIPS